MTSTDIPNAEVAAPLDALLVQAAQSPMRRFVPDASVLKFAGNLVTHPRRTGYRLSHLARELGRIGVGASDTGPSRRDRRFKDPAWTENPLLHRLMQAYLAAGKTAHELVADSDLHWRDAERMEFLVENLVDALAPANIPLVNPSSAKAAIDTGGMSLVHGFETFLKDMASAPRIPEMVDGSGFRVGENLAATPGDVVHRSEIAELILYRPQTEQVRQLPLLIVPPTINKFYALDLAPDRSLIEYLVQQGQQVYVMSWRNPDARHSDWGLDAYAQSVLDNLDIVQRMAGTEQAVLMGVCSGGIISSLAVNRLADIGQQERLAGFTLLVTVLDSERAGTASAIMDENMAVMAKADSARRGYLDGRALAEVFAWLRPDDLIWNYWVNNYLLGKKPPAFDILYWNADTTRMTAHLHSDFVDFGIDNPLTKPGALNVLDSPVDLSRVTLDSYVVAGSTDHITPWQNCYRTTGLLGGETRFVLSNSGHIAALVNPTTNPKASFQSNKENPEDAQQWLSTAQTNKGSWWSDYDSWLADRCGSLVPAPELLVEPLAPAPGTYVYEK
ncbi:MAG: PHA/PHB synthase family protein [Actinomycetales bacterium]